MAAAGEAPDREANLPHRWLPALAVTLALAIWAGTAWVIQPRCFASSDFYAFWAAAKLADYRMYEAAAVHEVQRAECADVPNKRFIRPAIEALILYPLGRLSFKSAYSLWFLMNAVACLAFLRLRRSGPREILATAAFLPLIWSFGLGQDAPLLLLAVMAGVRLLDQGRGWLGGSLLGVCWLKPNILFVLPLVLAVRRQLTALAAMCLAAALIYFGAAPAAGFDWPARFLKAALENEAAITPNIVGLPGLVPQAGPGIGLRIAIAALGGAVTLAWTRKQDWQAALCSALAAGLVFGPRAMIYDGVFLLPVLLDRLTTIEIIVAGLAMGLVVSPLRPFVQLTSPIWLWIATSQRRGAGNRRRPC